MMAAGLSSTLKKRQDEEEVLLMLHDRRQEEITARINSSSPETVAGTAATAAAEERASPGPKQDETSPRRPVPAAHYTAVGASLSARADRKTCCFYSKPQNLELCVPPQHVGYLTRQRRPEIRGSVNLKSLNRRMKKKDRTI
ncbi:hypothetical protein ABVT39_016424 [Epinephelus coioides]